MSEDLAFTDHVPEAARADILDRLKAYNNALLGPTDRRELFIPLRNDAGEIDGGLIGYTGRGWLSIEMVYVPERLRGQGMAGRLLQTAEDEARRRGCRGAVIDTINPVARRAYEAQGFSVFGRIDGFTGDFDLTWLIKRYAQP
ncbi:GNAT family N-acetyltransferase [Rhizobium halophytocola]|nr:GNAT family N-acetyltransferase [Rhizobium halophytocola]